MPMLDRASWLNYIKTSLGYPVVNVYMTDEMIEQQITFAIRKVLPYVNAVEFIEVGRKTEFKDRFIYAVIRVHQMGYVDAQTSTQMGASYYDMLITRSIYNQLGGTDLSQYSGSQGLVNAALYNYYYEEVKADLNPIGFRLIGSTLFVDDNTGGSGPYTAEVISDRSLANLTEDYQSWLLEYSLALTKITCGEIRSKVTIQGSPLTLNGSELKAEGKAEKEALEAKLGNQMSLYFCTR